MSPYIAIRTEYEYEYGYEYGYEYEYRTTNDTVVYILNLHTNQPHTNLHTNGHYIHFYIQIALCQNYARLCSIMLVMPILCQLCFMLRPCYYANSYAGIIRSPQFLRHQSSDLCSHLTDVRILLFHGAQCQNYRYIWVWYRPSPSG